MQAGTDGDTLFSQVPNNARKAGDTLFHMYLAMKEGRR